MIGELPVGGEETEDESVKRNDEAVRGNQTGVGVVAAAWAD